MRSQKSKARSQRSKKSIITLAIENLKVVIPAIPKAFGSRESFLRLQKDSGQAGMTAAKNIRMFNCWSIIILLLLFTIHFSLFTLASASEKWPGVDESVIEKYAKEHGREAREPFINTDQGDLLLFVFLLAGTVGGFAAGYSWRMLMVEKAPEVKGKEQKTTK
jgi:cobalt/nickel transport protein